MSKKELSKVILSIHDTIKEFSSGDIDLDEARERYKNYSRSLENVLPLAEKAASGEAAHSPGNLCFMHNIENFSLVSTVFLLSTAEVTPVYSRGNRSLQEKLTSYVENNRPEISFASTKEFQLLETGEDTIDGHRLYITPIDINSRFIILFASASSSTYFSETMFLQFSGYIKKFLSVLIDNNQPILFDFNYQLSHYIRKKLLERVKKEEINVHLFLFSTLHKTFDHMGIHSIIEISMTIKKLIENHYNTPCQPFSLNEYLVILPAGETGFIKSRHMIDFVYNDINIPYKQHTVTLAREEDVYTFWNRIYSDQSLLLSKTS